MACRATLPFGLLPVIYSLLFSTSSGAQVLQVPKRCTPPPVTDKVLLRARSDQSTRDATSPSPPPEDDGPHRNVIIESIQFDGPIHLSDSDIARIISDANRGEWNANGSGWVDDLVQIGLRGAWQDRGYFKVKVNAEAHSLGGDSSVERFLVTAHVQEGLQYHLGDLRFVDGTGIPEAELRTVFPLHGGEIFNVSLIRAGIEALTKLYGSRGYIDFTAVPRTEVDDNLQRISLVMRLDEQKQFRIGKFEILGLTPNLEGRLSSIIRPGEIFDDQVVYDFFRTNKLALPSGVSFEDMEALRNVKAGIVDLMFDFRPCP